MENAFEVRYIFFYLSLIEIVYQIYSVNFQLWSNKVLWIHKDQLFSHSIQHFNFVICAKSQIKIMKPLATTQRVLTLLWMLPFDEGTSLPKRIAYVTFSIFTFLANLAGLIASVAFIRKFKTIDLEAALYSLFHMFGSLTMAYSMFVAFFLRPGMSNIFRKLAEIYNECKGLFRFCDGIVIMHLLW